MVFINNFHDVVKHLQIFLKQNVNKYIRYNAN